MTLCPTYMYLSTNDRLFETDKKEDKTGEYWVTSTLARHGVLALDFAAVYLDSWTLCLPPHQSPHPTNPSNVSGMQRLFMFIFSLTVTRVRRWKNLVNTIPKGMPIKFSKIFGPKKGHQPDNYHHKQRNPKYLCPKKSST